MTRRSAAGTGSGLHRVRSFRSSSICASHRVLRVLQVTPVRWLARPRTIRLLAMTPSRTAAYPGASIAPSAELVPAIQGADQAADPPQTRWAACISPRDVTNPNSRPDATPESASAENHSPETATEPGQPISCSAPASTWDAQEHAGSWWWFRNEGGGDFATRMGGMSGQPRRNAPLNGLRAAAQSGSAARDLPGVQEEEDAGRAILRHPDQSLVAARHVRPSACRYGYGPALVVHSEDLSSVARPSGGELT